MSTRAKITLGSSIVWAVACVIGVHYMKIWEKDVRRLGRLPLAQGLGNADTSC